MEVWLARELVSVRGNEGQAVYLMNMETNTAEMMVERNFGGESAKVCMTSVGLFRSHMKYVLRLLYDFVN